MAFMSLLTPNAKYVSFSPQLHPLPRQTQSRIILPSKTSIFTTQVAQNLFCNRNGEIHTRSANKLSSHIVRAAATLGSDDGDNMPAPGKRQVRRRTVFWVRMLECLAVAPGSPAGAVVLALTHLLCLFAPFCFTWDGVGVALGLSVVTALGVTLSYHRNLCHRSFKLPKWLEYTFAYCGVHALQMGDYFLQLSKIVEDDEPLLDSLLMHMKGNPIGWVSTHRQHHQHCDSEKDPHSPIQGFWYSHLGWMLDFNSSNERSEIMPTNVGDLENQFFYKFIQLTYIIHPILLGTLLYAIGGFPYVVWGMGVRAVLTHHITFLVNSACHIWGNQAWNTGDLSRNNWLVALFTFGEGWHNNHHAFEFSARHGLEWWQIDITWYVVWILQSIGLASEVKLPTEAQKRKMAFNNN